MGCTVNNMNLNSVGMAIKTESVCKKIFKLLSALIFVIISVTCMGYFFTGHKNVNQMQGECASLVTPEEQVYCTNSTLYDFNFQAGPFPEDDPNVIELKRLL